MKQVIQIIDTITEDSKFAKTNNITNILHNIERFPKDTKNQIQESLITSEQGITIFIGLGRYKVELKISKNKIKGEMIYRF